MSLKLKHGSCKLTYINWGRQVKDTCFFVQVPSSEQDVLLL